VGGNNAKNNPAPSGKQGATGLAGVSQQSLGL
jgi:hypothetical protein